jgi:SM-20-related protein
MLNPSLDLAGLAREFAQRRRIRIHGVLAPDFAAAVAADMGRLPYKWFCATGKGVEVFDPREIAGWSRGEQQELQHELHSAASRGQGFAYLGFGMTDAWRVGVPDTPLGRLHTGIAAPETQAAIRTITGADTFDHAFAQATEYRPGHYLTRHLDDPAGEARRFAFVWGLTPAWHPDWGGLLQFYARDGRPLDSFAPGFNTLDLFDVSHVHAVTYVAPFALHPRHAVSGWYMKGEPRR